MTPRFILSVATTVIELIGLVAVVWGVALLSAPVAIIVAGLVLVLVGFAADVPPPKGDR